MKKINKIPPSNSKEYKENLVQAFYGIEEETINKYVWDYIYDCELAVKALASDLKGYTGYKTVIAKSCK